MRKLTLLLIPLLAVVFTGCKGSQEKWGYTGDIGPAQWGSLKTDYATCDTGKEQSPINLEDAEAKSLPALKLNYSDSEYSVVDNGHTIQANFDKNSTFTVNGKTYSLIQIHFHAPSENALNGELLPLEGHLVHAAEDGSLAVIGMFFKPADGAEKNSGLAKVFSNVPSEKKEAVTVEGEKLNGKEFLPGTSDYYRFKGSLTTPPCSEGVTWTVMQKPVEVPQAQIDAFTEHYQGNNRPVQPLNERTLYKN